MRFRKVSKGRFERSRLHHKLWSIIDGPWYNRLHNGLPWTMIQCPHVIHGSYYWLIKTFDKDATCQNTPGSFMCICNNGFEGSEFRSFRHETYTVCYRRLFWGKIMVLVSVIILMNVCRHHAVRIHIVMILWDLTFVIVFLDMNLTHIKNVSTSTSA